VAKEDVISVKMSGHRVKFVTSGQGVIPSPRIKCLAMGCMESGHNMYDIILCNIWPCRIYKCHAIGYDTVSSPRVKCQAIRQDILPEGTI